MDMGRATAAVLYCTEKVGWYFGWNWAIALPSWATILNVLGYGSFGAICVLPLINTFIRAWSMKAVGGGTRGEPFVVSLLSYVCPFLLTCIDNNWDTEKLWIDESAWLNGVGACFYVVYLCLFLLLADADDRRTTVQKWIPAGAAYIGLTAVAGLLIESTVAVKWLCTLAGVASACVSLILALYVVEEDVENLPDAVSSSISLLYYIVWGVRSFYPERDNHAMVQNLAGVLCSVAFLVLLKRWQNKDQTAAAAEEEPFLPKLPPPQPRQPDPPLHHKPQPQQPLQPPAIVQLQQAANPAENMPAENILPPPAIVQPQQAANPAENMPAENILPPPAIIQPQQAANPAENMPAENILPQPNQVKSAPTTPVASNPMENLNHVRRRTSSV